MGIKKERKTYMANQIVRIGALNCFESLHEANALILLKVESKPCPLVQTKKRKKKVANEIA
jgi:hypothetical protein